MKKTRQEHKEHAPQARSSECIACATASKMVLTIDDEIVVLHSIYCGEITLKEASSKLFIPEDEVEAMLEGFFMLSRSQTVDHTINDTANYEAEEIINPDVFEKLFLEYITLTEANEISGDLKTKVITKLDEMLSTFPLRTFPELCSTHFEWDDATRFVLDNMSRAFVIDMVRRLRDEFWQIYSHRMRVVRDTVKMKSKYYDELEIADKRICDMRNEILAIYNSPIEDSMLYAMRFMHDIPNAP